MKSDNLAALVSFKEKAYKWKNVALLFAVLSLMLAMKLILGSRLSDNLVGDHIAKIKIEGIIFEDDFRSEVLKNLAEEDSTKAVIVVINSPGGGIVGSEILFHNLREIAKKKPMVVVIESLGASGGYMAAIASDYIIAHNGTLTGSIGVLMESPEITGLTDKLGIKFNTYKSSPLKGSPSPFEKPNSLVDTVIKESILDSYSFFVELVKERRGEKIAKSSTNTVFDGRVFTGRQALKAGLIDKIGSFDDSLTYLAEKKIDVENLPIEKVEIVKEEKRILNRIWNLLPFFNKEKVGNSANKIMAVME